MPTLVTTYQSLSEKTKAIIVFAAVVLSAVMIFLVASGQMSREAKRMMRPYEQSQQLINKYIDSLKKPDHLSEKQFTTFKTQQQILSLRKSHYLQLSRLFFRNYYGVLILTMLYSCIGGVVLFIIINKGWGGAKASLRALFLGILMVVTFCGFFPPVFKQQENFNENIKYYMNYTKAELNIMNQLSRLENFINFAKKDNPIPAKNGVPEVRFDTAAYMFAADSMIDLNTVTINNLTNYVLTIDANEIKSIGDVYKMVANSTSGNDTLDRKK